MIKPVYASRLESEIEEEGRASPRRYATRREGIEGLDNPAMNDRATITASLRDGNQDRRGGILLSEDQQRQLNRGHCVASRRRYMTKRKSTTKRKTKTKTKSRKRR
ncbi:MAG: hypothetical protein KatS3mg111_2852 [Pirellulaceae bacterium]|nr:MAG: hypothetical protein KatS3mg111_2852 [Pirellulaceae bacterium]